MRFTVSDERRGAVVRVVDDRFRVLILEDRVNRAQVSRKLLW